VTIAVDADVLVLLRTIDTKLDLLLSHAAHVQALPHKAALSRDDRALLPVLAATVEDLAFSTREVMERAALFDVELRAALAAAGLINARKLGKWLRTIEGRTIAGLRLERIGVDRDGIIWRVLRVSNSHTHTAAGDDDRGA